MVKIYVSYDSFKKFYCGDLFVGRTKEARLRTEEYFEVIVPRNAVAKVTKEPKGYFVIVRDRREWGKKPSDYIV